MGVLFFLFLGMLEREVSIDFCCQLLFRYSRLSIVSDLVLNHCHEVGFYWTVRFWISRAVMTIQWNVFKSLFPSLRSQLVSIENPTYARSSAVLPIVKWRFGMNAVIDDLRLWHYRIRHFDRRANDGMTTTFVVLANVLILFPYN